MEKIELRDSGRRVYLVGNTYSLRDAIKDIGGHWDADAKAWWVASSKRSAAEAVLAKAEETSKARTEARASLTGPMMRIEGNTYPVRDRLAALGARWNARFKMWEIASSHLEEAKAIVATVPAKTTRSFRSKKMGRCWECGGYGPLNSDGECGRC